jgi:hypothetical protein
MNRGETPLELVEAGTPPGGVGEEKNPPKLRTLSSVKL